MRATLATVAFLLLAVLAGTGPAAARPDVERGVAWEYRVSVDPDLARLRVRACFRDAPAFLQLDYEESLAYLRWADPSPVAREGAMLRVTSPGPGGCLEYEVDLASLAAEEGGSPHARRFASAVVTPPGLVLLRPPERPPGTRAVATFDLPPGVSASVPWRPREGTTFELDDSTFTLMSRIAIGRFATQRVTAEGCAFDVALLERPRGVGEAGVERWLATAARAVATVHGRLPESRVQVVVQPGGPGDGPVGFGQSFDGGGRSLHLHLAPGATDDELPGEWVAVHELVHATMPTIRQEDAWFSEGFATYYQEVARGRAGLRTEQETWQNLNDGFERGRRGTSERTLAEESRSMHRHHSYHRVYWSGTAIVLLADLEIRRASGGKASIDDAMRAMSAEIGHGPKLHTAAELVEFVDAQVAKGAFGRVARRWLDRPEFPALEEAYAALGIEVRGGRVRLGAEGADLRRAIAGPR